MIIVVLFNQVFLYSKQKNLVCKNVDIQVFNLFVRCVVWFLCSSFK